MSGRESQFGRFTGKHMMRPIFIVFFCIMVSQIFSDCTKNLQKEEIVYKNDFEYANLLGIEGGKITTFNSSKVLGNFDSSGFDFKINNLEAHDYIEVSFSLYIHDQWIGNTNDEITKMPDLWQLNIDGNNYINTTFSNGGFMQSYPDNYKVDNPSKANSFHSYSQGICNGSANTLGTSLYKIVKTTKSSSTSFSFECRDVSGSPNTADNHCKSWSIDDLVIKSIKFR